MRLHLIPLLVILVLVQLRTGVFAQSITLEKRNVTIGQVFKEIELQSGHVFFYKKAELDRTERISVELRNADLESAVSKVLKGRGFDFKIINKTIVLRKTAQKPTTEIQNKVSDLPDVPMALSGIVSDTTGAALLGVSVLVKGTTKGTITDRNGFYELSNVSSDAVLRFSMIGFTTQEVAVKGKSKVSIILQESNLKLDEVSVISTGFEQIPAERATGSFSFVDNKLFNRQVSTDVISRLKGIVPSLLFDERTGTNKLSIRGRSTILANDQPLIVVDNFPYEGNINSINPNDIESVSVLKDAAAASIWGVRAGNGVIVITTKRGRWNAKPRVEVNSNVTIADKPDLYYNPTISSSEFIDLEKELFRLGNYDANLNNTTTRPVVSPVVEILAKQKNGTLTQPQANSEIDAYRNNDVKRDLAKYFYRKAVNQQYALNITGGAENYNYFLSAGFDKNLSNAIGNSYNRINLSMNNTIRLSKHLEAIVNLNYIKSKTLFDNTISSVNTSALGGVYPYTQLADDNGNALSIAKDYRQQYVEKAEAAGFLNWQYRPLEELNYSDQSSKINSSRINTALRWLMLPGLNAEIRYQYQNQTNDYRNLQTTDSYFTRNLINQYTSVKTVGLDRNIPFGAILSSSHDNLDSHNGRVQINFAKDWNIHSVNALAGFEVREIKTAGYGNKFYGYDINTGSFATVNYDTTYSINPSAYGSIPGPSLISGTLDRFRSYFANASYTYKSKYTVSLSGRRDESNLFGVESNQKGVPLWSVGAGWKLSDEAFFHMPSSTIKLRATYGYNGNFDNTVTAYTTARYLGNSYWVRQPYAGLQNPPNNQLRWEKNRVTNFGLDFAMFNGLLSGSLDYYRKKGEDLIGYGPVNATSGFTSFKGNVAAMKGRGLDFVVTINPIRRRLYWSSTFMFSYVADKITDYTLKPTISNIFLDASGMLTSGASFSPVVGKPLFSIYSYKWAGLSSDDGSPQGVLSNTPSKDYANLLKLPLDSLVYNGRATPPVFGAVRNSITYKAFSLSLNITYKFGYYFRRSSVNYGNLLNNNIGHGDYAKRWQKKGDELLTDVPSLIYPVNSSRDLFYARSEALIDKGDHIRLQDVQLSYTLSIKRNDRQAGTLQLYSYLNNVGIIWRANKHGIDPDYGSLIPAPRSIALGLRLGI